jgi:hypothetical protein
MSRATSSGVLMRPVVTPSPLIACSTNDSWGTPCSFARRPTKPSGSAHTPVRTGPGDTVMARTPCSPNCSAMTLVSALSAALETL